MNEMKKTLLLILILIFGLLPSFAYDIVLPKDKKTYVTTKYAFFVGQVKSGESISINGEHIHTASNGAFAHSVKLKEGENRIAVRSEYNTRIYKIFKNTPSETPKPALLEFEPQNFDVLKDNTPLRSTPIDYGMNRISHLFKDTHITVDGEQNGFYRVYLSKNKYAWIAKDAVTRSEYNLVPQFITMNSETFKNASVHTIEFTEKLPYTINETENEIIFKVYNPYMSDSSVYTINIRKPTKYTYKILSLNGTYVFKVNEILNNEKGNLEGLNITVDAGHGGSELGALGCLGDYEKDINLDIAIELQDLLSQMGACVTMTRECDGFISLEDRVKYAQDNCTNIFVSIHLNSIPDIPMDIHKNRGTSVYYYNKNSKILAQEIEKSLTSEINTRKDGIKTASFAVIRPTDYVGVLVETAYMTNPLDSVIYESDGFARKAARGIANGILNFVCK